MFDIRFEEFFDKYNQNPKLSCVPSWLEYVLMSKNLDLRATDKKLTSCRRLPERYINYDSYISNDIARISHIVYDTKIKFSELVFYVVDNSTGHVVGFAILNDSQYRANYLELEHLGTVNANPKLKTQKKELSYHLIGSILCAYTTLFSLMRGVPIDGVNVTKGYYYSRLGFKPEESIISYIFDPKCGEVTPSLHYFSKYIPELRQFNQLSENVDQRLHKFYNQKLALAKKRRANNLTPPIHRPINLNWHEQLYKAWKFYKAQGIRSKL